MHVVEVGAGSDDGEVVEGIDGTRDGVGIGIGDVDGGRAPRLHALAGDEEIREPGGLEGGNLAGGDQLELTPGGGSEGDVAGEIDISIERGEPERRGTDGEDGAKGHEAGLGEPQPGLGKGGSGGAGGEEILTGQPSGEDVGGGGALGQGDGVAQGHVAAE